MAQRLEETPAVTLRPTMKPTTVHDLPDQVLHGIIHRLNCHVSIIRAAAVCKLWRRIASTRGPGGYYLDWDSYNFVTCIGHYHVVDPSSSSGSSHRRLRHVFVPVHPSLNARHFSLDFLPSAPGGRPWALVHCHDSLLLLASQRRAFFPDLVVCEPISRRYHRIHPIPEMKYARCLGAFLGFRSHDTAMSDFTVTCVLCDDQASGGDDGVDVVTARVYNHIVPPIWRLKNGWEDWDTSRSRRRRRSGDIHLRGAASARFVGRARGSTFWIIDDDGGTVLALQVSSGKLSRFHLPEHIRREPRAFRFVDEEYRLHPSDPVMLRVVSLAGDELRVFAAQRKQGDNGGINIDDDTEWVHETSLRLPEATRGLLGHKDSYFSAAANIVAAGKGYVVLTPAEETWRFSVEFGTMNVERDHIRNRLPGEVYPYQLRRRPKVSACMDPCKRWRRKSCTDFCKCR